MDETTGRSGDPRTETLKDLRKAAEATRTARSGVARATAEGNLVSRTIEGIRRSLDVKTIRGQIKAAEREAFKNSPSPSKR